MKNQQGTANPLSPLLLTLVAVLVGVVGGFGAVVFRALIAFFHNLLFLGTLSPVYEANIHAPPSPWGPFVILVPVLGAAMVSFLVTHFAPEAKGHGVPEVMDSIYYNRGIIRPVVAVVKSLASAISIGSGGSVGREGPIIQIGSSFGSTLGQIISMPAWQRITLIASGTGAGIAATFNTPIGGLLFAVEIMLHEVSVRTLVPVAIATAIATDIGRMFFGDYPAFTIPDLQIFTFEQTDPFVLGSYVGLGLLAGIASALYILSIYACEDFFDTRVHAGAITRHMLGMLIVGILMYLLMISYGHYYIEGVGYAAIEDVLTGRLSELHLLALLFALKLLSTSLTLGSGASGGIFSPALFLGAMLGGTYGTVLGKLFPSIPFSPPAFAIAGMAGLVGGSTGAAMAAIVMIFEMTLDYNIILPITITVAISNGIRRILSKDTIYTLKLARRGHYMPEALQTNYQYLKRAKELMQEPVLILPASTSMEEFARCVLQQPEATHIPVENRNRIIGVASREIALKCLETTNKTTTLGEIVIDKYIIVAEDTTLFEIVNRMRVRETNVALVSSDPQSDAAGNIKGLITKQTIADAVTQAIDLFAG